MLTKLREQTLGSQRQPNFDHRKYAEMAASLRCEMAGTTKQQFLDSYAPDCIGSSTACSASPGGATAYEIRSQLLSSAHKTRRATKELD